jgi:hypothetical protein
MSHLGLRHLLPGMLKGTRYYSPFYWILRETRGKLTLKDKINDLGFLVATATTRLSRPSRQYAREYQGFMEMQGLRPFRGVTLEEYLSEAQKDFDVIHSRVLDAFGREGSRHRTVVFPSGSAHQIMPPQLAAKVLSHADFAFHEKDDFSKDYEQAGLNVIRFGNPPEQICELIASASTVFSTDSFSFPFGADVERQGCSDDDGNAGTNHISPLFPGVAGSRVACGMQFLLEAGSHRPGSPLPGGEGILCDLGEP